MLNSNWKCNDLRSQIYKNFLKYAQGVVKTSSLALARINVSRTGIWCMIQHNLSVCFLLGSGDSDIDSSPGLVNFNFHLITLI